MMSGDSNENEDETDINNDGIKPGELSASSDDDGHRHIRQNTVRYCSTPTPKKQVALKVVKVNNDVRLDKFSHLRNYPDSQCFLDEMVDNKVATKPDVSNSTERKQ